MHLCTGAIYDFDQLLYCINNVIGQNTSRFWVGDWFSKLRFLVECTCRQLYMQAICGAFTTVVILTILFLNSISVKYKNE